MRPELSVEADNTKVLTMDQTTEHITMIFQSEREREIFIPEQSAQIESSAETKNHLERRRAVEL